MLGKKKDIVIGVSGASGVGKTTLLRSMAMLPRLGDSELRVWLPQFITTRPARISDKDGEIFCISINEFIELEKNGELILSFQAHEHQYGLLYTGLQKQNSSDGKCVVYAQVVHPDVGGLLKEKLATTHDVKICMLVASPQTICRRLEARNDNLLSEELLDRQKMALKSVPNYVDHIIDAEQSPSEVLRHIMQTIETSCLTSGHKE